MDASQLESEIRDLLEQAELLYAGGDWHEAVDAYSRVLEIAPDLAPIYVQRGLLICEMGNPIAAAADFERALQIDQQYGLAYYGRGWVKHARGDFQGELEDARRGLELDPDNAARYYLRLGSAYHGLKRYQQAVDAYSRSIALAPQQEGAIYNRGLLYSEMRRFEDALADFNRALDLDPDWVWVFDARGDLFMEQGDLDSALSDYNQAIRLQPQNPVGYLKRGAAYRLKGEREKAIADYERVLDRAGHPVVRRIAANELRTLRSWWLNGFFGLLTLQPQSYREVAEERGETWRAFLLVAAVGVIVVVLPLALNLQGTDVVDLRDRLVARGDLPAEQANWIIGVFGALTPLYWVALAGAVTLLARLFGAEPRFGPLLRATAYTTIFSLLTIIPFWLADTVATALGFWSFIIAIQAVLGLSYRRAFGLGCLGTIGATFLALLLFVCAFVFLRPG